MSAKNRDTFEVSAPAVPVRVILAEDHDMVRAGFEALVQQFGGYEIVASVDDGCALLTALEKTPADVVVTDLSMPSMNGVDAIAGIRRQWPQVRILVVSMDETGHVAKRAVELGATGYVSKASAVMELRLALDAVMQGRRYLSQQILRQMLAAEDDRKMEKLSARQREVLKLIALGNSAKQIGAILNLSSKTVDSHRMRLMSQLGIHDIANLTRYALKMGVVA